VAATRSTPLDAARRRCEFVFERRIAAQQRTADTDESANVIRSHLDLCTSFDRSFPLAGIICQFGVNALSSKGVNPFRLSAPIRLIEGPGRPEKQRFAIPAMAQGEPPRLLIASSATRPLRVVHGASSEAASRLPSLCG
jgi:hypothetical protein